MRAKPRVAVHKLTSCDGCQLAFLNLGERLLALADRVELVHFAEAGPVSPEAEVDVAFVEGGVSTPEEIERLRVVRGRARFLVAIGACAVAGGVQALRNHADGRQWLAAVYPQPAHVRALDAVAPVAAHAKVDLALSGCPVDEREVLAALASLLLGATPAVAQDKVCLECKRRGLVCVTVARGLPCMGPVTRGGCGALCPSLGRDCYGCFGPADLPSGPALAHRFAALGLPPEAVRRRFLSVAGAPAAFVAAAGAAEEGERG